MLPALAIDHLPPVSIAWRSKGVRSFLRLKPNLDRAAPLGSKTPQPYVEDRPCNLVVLRIGGLG
jgi:hypothetical protein